MSVFFSFWFIVLIKYYFIKFAGKNNENMMPKKQLNDVFNYKKEQQLRILCFIAMFHIYWWIDVQHLLQLHFQLLLVSAHTIIKRNLYQWQAVLAEIQWTIWLFCFNDTVISRVNHHIIYNCYNRIDLCINFLINYYVFS